MAWSVRSHLRASSVHPLSTRTSSVNQKPCIAELTLLGWVLGGSVTVLSLRGLLVICVLTSPRTSEPRSTWFLSAPACSLFLLLPLFPFLLLLLLPQGMSRGQLSLSSWSLRPLLSAQHCTADMSHNSCFTLSPRFISEPQALKYLLNAARSLAEPFCCQGDNVFRDKNSN